MAIGDRLSRIDLEDIQRRIAGVQGTALTPQQQQVVQSLQVQPDGSVRPGATPQRVTAGTQKIGNNTNPIVGVNADGAPIFQNTQSQGTTAGQESTRFAGGPGGFMGPGGTFVGGQTGKIGSNDNPIIGVAANGAPIFQNGPPAGEPTGGGVGPFGGRNPNTGEVIPTGPQPAIQPSQRPMETATEGRSNPTGEPRPEGSVANTGADVGAPFNNTVFGEINQRTDAINTANRDLGGIRDLVTDPNAQRSFVTENPFFKALADESERRLLNNQAARGKVGSGETAEALQNSILLLGQDLLNNNINQRQNLVTQDLNIAGQRGGVADQRFNIATLGANAAAGQATATQNTAGQNAATQRFGTGSITDLITQGANARAAGTIGAANARTAGLNSAINTGLGIGTIMALGA